MPFDIGAAGGGASAGIVGNIMDIAFGGIKQKQQLKGQKKALEQQNAAQLDMWNKTNYEAQMEHIKNAGLNPGLLYGMSGGGATTTGSASAMPTQNQGHGMDIAAGVQMAMMQAQKDVLESQAEKNRAEAENLRGVEREQGYQTIENLRQEIRNKQAQEALTKAETELKDLEIKYQGESLDTRLGMINTELNNMFNSGRIIENQADISDATKKTAIAQIKANYAMTLLEMEVKRKGMQLTDAQIGKIGAEIVTMFKEAETSRWNAETNARNAGTKENELQHERMINNVSKDMQLTVDVVKQILLAVGLGKALSGERTVVKGFGK